ncbi:mitochondrial substrate carrier, partial [Haematococcus lacustris]
MSREHADLVAGAVAGAANVLSGYPLDTVKVRMQSSSPGAPHGAMACLRHILRHEGVPGLFRGVTTPLVGGALESGVNYMVSS